VQHGYLRRGYSERTASIRAVVATVFAWFVTIGGIATGVVAIVKHRGPGDGLVAGLLGIGCGVLGLTIALGLWPAAEL
jgi:hypothetical protein